MGFPVIDEYHQGLNKLVEQISAICLSAEFIALKKELESHYSRCHMERASLLAFQDALYAIIAQEGIELHKP